MQRKPYKKVDVTELIPMYKAGKSTHDIARELGISQRQVYVKLRDAGAIDPHRPPKKHYGAYGRKRVDTDGYYAVYMPDHPNSEKRGWVLEHRLIMSQMLGRPLKKGEVVHHKNHNRLDNRPENLELFASPGEHTKVEHPEILDPTYTEQEMLDTLRRLAEELGRSPVGKDLIGRGPSIGTYYYRFGSWTRAKELAGV